MKKLKKTKILFLCIVSFCAGLFFSCASNQPLYNWYDYDSASYWYSRTPTESSRKYLVKQYERIIYGQKKGQASRQIVPPGICADYAYFLYLDGSIDEALAMLDMEANLYPESTAFICNLRKMIEEGN